LNPPPAPRLSLKSPLLALLISIPLPGFGHFYIGSFLRGVVILIAVYIVLPALTSLHGAVTLICWPIAIGFVARDAWLCAKAEVLKETSELAAGVKPRRGLVWTWAACRAAWIVVLPGLAGLGMLFSAAVHARQGHMLAALINGASAAIPLAIAWLAGGETWRVVTGAVAVTEGAMKAEIGTTVIVTGVCALLVAITIPYFSGLFRYSAEGGIKGNLGELRQAVERYRLAHDGRSPDSIGAMVEATTIPGIPVLWRKSDKIPHSRTAEAAVVADRTATDSGRWAFVVSPSSPILTGALFIDCTHTDTRGRVWSEY
jgi:hypothetical protein